jgi:dipeptidyl aminopeptidase/acylaminoacyl peptidase
MPDRPSTIQRELDRVQVRPYSIDEFHRRRDRKQRNQRIRAGLLAAIVAIVGTAVIWRAFDATPARTPAGRVHPTVSQLIPSPIKVAHAPIVVRPGSIAFVDWHRDGTGIFVYDPTSGRHWTLVNLGCTSLPGGTRSCPGVRVNGMSWSPDGTELAFSLQQTHGSHQQKPTWTFPVTTEGIWTLTLATGETTQLSRCAEPTCSWQGTLDWSPDGSTIAYTQMSAQTSGIWTMRADGSDPRQLDTGGHPAADPTWSPDGRKIAFAQDAFSSEGGVLAVTGFPTGTPHLLDVGLIPLYGLGAPAWSPDGSRIAFLEGRCGPAGRVWVNRIGVPQSQLIRIGHVCQGFLETGPTWSPDGSHLAIAGNGQLFEARPDGTGVTALTRAWGEPAWYPVP